MQRKKIIMTAAGLALAGGLVAGGSAFAFADTATPSPSTSGGTTSGSNQGPGGVHTPVTGDELTKVTAAVTAYDSTISVTQVQKDADGSYDVDGTKSGTNIRLDVSADLATITQGGGRGGHGGGSNDTPVTGDEASKVIAAVTAKDSAATITEVRKDPDGSYDALGTKSGSPVMYDVSADLATITEHTGGPGGHGGPGDSSSSSSSSGTSGTSSNPADANGTSNT